MGAGGVQKFLRIAAVVCGLKSSSRRTCFFLYMDPLTLGHGTCGLLRAKGQARHCPVWHLLFCEGFEETQFPFVELLLKMGTLE